MPSIWRKSSETVSITAAAVVGSNIQYTTSSSHGFSVGSTVSVTGVTPAAFNITNLTINTVTNTSPYRFTVPVGSTGATGTATVGGSSVASGNPWRKIKTVYRKTEGAWQSVRRVWRKTSGAWGLIFEQSLTPSIENKVEITKANTATQTVRLTGKLYHWLNSTAVTYQFARGTDGSSYSNISGASGTSTNPASGGSNTNDQYTLLQADVIANTTNYYIYVSKATNSTFGTEQTSSSDPVTVEAPRNLTLTNSKTSNAITITWNNDTVGSLRYEYQWKLNSSPTWSSSIFLAPGTTTTSFTRTGLTPSTGYDFRVRGWTGSSDNFGYFGNWAEALNVQTNTSQAPNDPTALYAAGITKNAFSLGWTKSTIDATHDAATSYDYGVNQSTVNPPSTLITSGNPGNNQYRNKPDAETNAYETVGGSLSEGTVYYGWVRANNAGGPSNWVRTSAVTTLISKPPNAVGSLTHDAASRTQTSLRFTWQIPTIDATHDGATYYKYHTSTINSEPLIANYNGYLDGGSHTNVTVSGLTSNTLYYFWIRAGNSDGEGNVATSSGTTLAVSNPPGAPTITVSNPSPSGIGLSWSQGGGGNPTSYQIAVSTGTTPPSPGTTSSFTEIDAWYDVGLLTSRRTTALAANTTYYAWVRASNGDGTSGPSNRGNVTTLLAPTVNNPSWSGLNNFQRTNYTHWTTGRARPSATTRRAFMDQSGITRVEPGNIPTEYSATNNTSITVALLGTAYNGTQTVTAFSSNANGEYVEWTGASTTTETFTSDTDGTVTGNTRFRYGWNNGTITLGSGSGTFAQVSPAGFEFEIYNVVSGGTAIHTAFYSDSTSGVSPTVNGVTYNYAFLSGRSIDIMSNYTYDNSANPRYARIRMLAIDFDNKVWLAPWSSRI